VIRRKWGEGSNVGWALQKAPATEGKKKNGFSGSGEGAMGNIKRREESGGRWETRPHKRIAVGRQPRGKHEDEEGTQRNGAEQVTLAGRYSMTSKKKEEGYRRGKDSNENKTIESVTEENKGPA